MNRNKIFSILKEQLITDTKLDERRFLSAKQIANGKNRARELQKEINKKIEAKKAKKEEEHESK